MSDISKYEHNWITSLRQYPKAPLYPRPQKNNSLQKTVNKSFDEISHSSTLSTHSSMRSHPEAKSSKEKSITDKESSTSSATSNYTSLELYLEFLEKRMAQLNRSNRIKTKTATPVFSHKNGQKTARPSTFNSSKTKR